MTIRDLPLSWYIDRLHRGEVFSMCMFGDGEWIAATHDNVGGQNAEGTVYAPALCDELEAVLRFQDPEFYFTTPQDLKYSGLLEPIDRWLKERGLEIEFLEKDVWNCEFREGRAWPFIKELREHPIVMISNESLRGLYFLNMWGFVEVGYPNCFEEVDRAVEEAAQFVRNDGRPTVFLVSMGLAGPVFVHRLHKRLGGKHFILELGSVWDTFVGGGGQRGFRAELYDKPAELLAWRKKNLGYGIEQT